MTITTELLVMIVINVLLGGVYIGGLAMSIKFVEAQIKRLEEKQDKHNCVIERLYKVENDVEKAHLRIDYIEEKQDA